MSDYTEAELTWRKTANSPIVQLAQQPGRELARAFLAYCAALGEPAYLGMTNTERLESATQCYELLAECRRLATHITEGK